MTAWAWSVAKALAAAVVGAAAYLVGVLSGDDTLTDVTTVQWLGLVVFLGAGFGITWAAPANRPRHSRGGPGVAGGRHARQ